MINPNPGRAAVHSEKMNNYREILTSLIRRAVFAVAAGWLGYWFLATASGGWFDAHRLFFGMACLVAAATIIAPPLARLIAEPSGNLFYPSQRFDRPPPMYSIPKSKRAKGLYEEAIAGFEKIAQDYPDEVKPYIEMIDIAIVNLKDPERANAVYQRGILVLKKNEDKEVLARMYGAIRTRMNARPSN